MNYKAKVDIVKSLNTPSNTSLRYDCPFCYGSKTLGVSNRHGKISFNCFRMGCNTKGKADTMMLASELTSRPPALSQEPTKIALPQHWTYVSNAEALSWLAKWNCNWAISKGYAEVRYDPKEHRVCFLMRNSEGDIIDAAGRALHYNTKPKWKRLSNSNTPLVIGKGSTAYICEDAASACALAHFGAGVALLGTHITDTAIGVLRGFERCVVCLDPDAKLKALAMQRRVSMYVSTRVVFLEDDPKAYDKINLKSHLGLD